MVEEVKVSMQKQGNIVDEIAIDLLAGAMEHHKDAVEKATISKISKIKDINMSGRFGRTFLIHCCIYDYYCLAEIALNRGADVNLQDQQGFAPLHAAVKSGDSKLVALLLKNGALPNLKNMFGNTAAMDAVKNWEILKPLLDYGCDINIKNKGGVSPHDLINLHSEIVEQLSKYEKACSVPGDRQADRIHGL